MRSSFNDRWVRIELRLPTKKSVVTTSVPFIDSARLTTGCVCTPFGDRHRCELMLRLSVFFELMATSILPRPTLLLPSRGLRMLSAWKNDSVDAQFAAGAVHAEVREDVEPGVANTGKLRSCWS